MLQDIEFVETITNTLLVKLIFAPSTNRHVVKDLVEAYQREVGEYLLGRYENVFIVPCYRDIKDIRINVTDDGSESALSVKQQVEDVVKMAVEQAT